eukprot:scaffold36412_cov24-Prasinocladus_malaysianus.AAC.1
MTPKHSSPRPVDFLYLKESTSARVQKETWFHRSNHLKWVVKRIGATSEYFTATQTREELRLLLVFQKPPIDEKGTDLFGPELIA